MFLSTYQVDELSRLPRHCKVKVNIYDPPRVAKVLYHSVVRGEVGKVTTAIQYGPNEVAEVSSVNLEPIDLTSEDLAQCQAERERLQPLSV